MPISFYFKNCLHSPFAKKLSQTKKFVFFNKKKCNYYIFNPLYGTNENISITHQNLFSFEKWASVNDIYPDSCCCCSAVVGPSGSTKLMWCSTRVYDCTLFIYCRMLLWCCGGARMVFLSSTWCGAKPRCTTVRYLSTVDWCCGGARLVFLSSTWCGAKPGCTTVRYLSTC